ncbi:xanthine dehydrogenase small subunit [Acidovorax sp. SUPP1855]|uniref:xanthine dehydrogenase small subunit n=1 Tax=Acidovorax sp. SUPP1855 TaxID=431774 RepID=UPI0023DE43D5|nr:xanthine dehydrogenase small subunit [Acidovorax sp. SUPP1855]GKS82798.1 xanthine dehydrogenase small subunit [Acidovorax sp. SUPP1855]
MTTSRPLRFIRRGQPVTLAHVPPDRTLLEVLREDLGHTGTKEGCGEGDCGACTVVLGEAVDGRVRYRAVNSCIRLAHSIDGMALWTVEDLDQDPLVQPAPPATPSSSGAPSSAPGLHPAQEAMVQCHGSQCGFCTPGFVMSLFGMYQNHVCQGRAVTREQAVHDLSGNLCRCTGYRPILDAAERMAALPRMQVDEAQLLPQLASLTKPAPTPDDAYLAPDTLAELLAARAAHPTAQVVAGATDVGLWITKQHRQFAQMLDVTRAQELRRIGTQGGRLSIGAAVPLADAFDALQAHWPVLHRFAARFAGLPVRNSGTLGGNVANGSPIGDSMPLLIALGASVVLASLRGERTLALEDLYTGYRQNVMAPDELLVRIEVPLPAPGESLAAYKVSKRFDDDISAVCLVLNLDIADGRVRHARIGAGGVAATPARARQTEAALAGQPWTVETVERAAAALQAEFQPISDMRASGEYRRAVLAGLLRRFWLERQGPQAVPLPVPLPIPVLLEQLRPEALA